MTASVDKISMKKPLRIDIDLQLAGGVAWVGRSSMEIRMEVIQPVQGVPACLPVYMLPISLHRFAENMLMISCLVDLW